jgi:hypothetical protein
MEYHNPISFFEIGESIAYTAKQAIMAAAATVAAANDEVVDPEAPATRKAYDIKTKGVFFQTINTLI